MAALLMMWITVWSRRQWLRLARAAKRTLWLLLMKTALELMRRREVKAHKVKVMTRRVMSSLAAQRTLVRTTWLAVKEKKRPRNRGRPQVMMSPERETRQMQLAELQPRAQQMPQPQRMRQRRALRRRALSGDCLWAPMRQLMVDDQALRPQWWQQPQQPQR
jgi:hypothetical protein